MTEKQRNSLIKWIYLSVKKIYDWINKHLEGCNNPRAFGKALRGNRKGYWRYRVGDYRIIADIQDSKIVIIITDVGYRGNVYKGG